MDEGMNEIDNKKIDELKNEIFSFLKREEEERTLSDEEEKAVLFYHFLDILSEFDHELSHIYQIKKVAIKEFLNKKNIDPEKQSIVSKLKTLKDKNMLILTEDEQQNLKKHSKYAIAFLYVFDLVLYDNELYYCSNKGYQRFRPILDFFLANANPNVTQRLANEVYFLCQAHTAKELEPLPKNYIILKNGIYDFVNDLFITFNEAEVLLKGYKFSVDDAINVSYDLKVINEYADKKSEFQKFLDDVLEPEYHDLIYELFGYCLYRSNPLQKAFLLYGDGQNGKSTLLRVLVEFLGQKNVVSRTLQELENQYFSRYSLRNKLANIFADLPSKALTNTSFFKALTGEDQISAEKKYSPVPFTFVNYAKMIFSANSFPESPDRSFAFFRRLILIPFSRKIEKPDPTILTRLTTEKELSYLFFKSIEALKRVLEKSAFTYNMKEEEIEKTYLRRSNPVLAFIDDCVVPDETGFIFMEDLYSAYVHYANKNKLPILNEIVFSRVFNQNCLYDKKPERKYKEEIINGEKHRRLLRGYAKLALKDEFKAEKKNESPLYSSD